MYTQYQLFGYPVNWYWNANTKRYSTCCYNSFHDSDPYHYVLGCIRRTSAPLRLCVAPRHPSTTAPVRGNLQLGGGMHPPNPS
jgi:hypothetical protein